MKSTLYFASFALALLLVSIIGIQVFVDDATENIGVDIPRFSGYKEVVEINTASVISSEFSF